MHHLTHRTTLDQLQTHPTHDIPASAIDISEITENDYWALSFVFNIKSLFALALEVVKKYNKIENKMYRATIEVDEHSD